jgi:hypothetical protein
MKKPYIIVLSIAGALLATLVLWYVRLGGFNSPVVQYTQEGPYFLAGVLFEGRVKDPRMGALFDSTSALLERKEMEGTLAAYFHNDPNKAEGKVKVFIGIAMTDTLTPIPAGWQWTTIPSRDAIKSTLDAHFMIAPVRMYPAMETLATELGRKLREESLELYPSERLVIAISPLD